MGTFRESRTAKNLLISYAFESQATTRYTFFANQARQDGYIQIAANLFWDDWDSLTFDQLAEKADTNLLTLEILDVNGSVIRTYTNREDKDFNRYPGGPPPPDR